MLDVTIDLITQTASSSLFAFCFCNLIIVIILVGSKPGSEFGQGENNSPLLEATIATKNGDQEDEIEIPKSFSEERDDLKAIRGVENAKRLLVVQEKCLNEDEFKEGEDEDVIYDDDEKSKRLLVVQEKCLSENENENEDEDDDELKKRVEEFIQKVNRGWKAELAKKFEFD